MSKIVMTEKTATWNRIGKTANATKIADALKEVGLDFEVEKRGIFFGPEMKQIKDNFATVRTDNEHCLGIVGKGYEICQNKAAFEFADFIDSSLKFTRGGMTYTGLCWVVGEMPEFEILGEKYTPAVVLQNSFNGKYCLRANIVPTTDSGSAMNIMINGVTNTLRVKHSCSLMSKMKQGQETLAAIADYMGELRKVAEKYASVKMDKEQIEMLTHLLFPIEKDMSEQVKARVEASRKMFLSCYDDEGNKRNRGNAWGMIRAYADYQSHTLSETKKGAEKKAEWKFMSNSLSKNNFGKFLKKLGAVTGK